MFETAEAHLQEIQNRGLPQLCCRWSRGRESSQGCFGAVCRLVERMRMEWATCKSRPAARNSQAQTVNLVANLKTLKYFLSRLFNGISRRNVQTKDGQRRSTVIDWLAPGNSPSSQNKKFGGAIV